MSGIMLYLNSVVCSECINDVVSFVGMDVSGSFGIQFGWVCLIIIFDYGLVCFCKVGGEWFYLVCLGVVFNFVDNELMVNI